MQLSGTLDGFPLPEVLLFLGDRTGRLRILSVPKFSDMELDLSGGQAHTLHISAARLTEKREMVTLLSVIVEAGQGIFEFNDCPVAPAKRKVPVLITDLVRSMVIHVEFKLSQKRAELSLDDVFVLITPAPEIWIDLHLKQFYEQSQKYLKNGAQVDQLALKLGLEESAVRLHLSYLRQLGFVRIAEGDEANNLRQRVLQDQLADKSQRYQFAAEASDLIMRTGKLILSTGNLSKSTR